MPTRARSLRLKLALWYVLVFFVIQTVLLGGVAFLRRGLIQRTLEDELTLSAEEMVDSILAAEVAWTDERIHDLVPVDAAFELYVLRSDDGTVLLSQGVENVERLPFNELELVTAGPVGGVHRTLEAERGLELIGEPVALRMVTLPVRRGEELVWFQAAARDETLVSLLGPFRDLVVIGAPVGLLAAGLAAWIIAGRAVAPMRRLSRAARGVSPESLGERFRVPTTDEEVARLERELNSALERLEAGYRAQDQFISNVSHELRTPIAALLTQAQVAQMGESRPEKAQAFLKSAERSLQRLGKLVESFLTLARSDLSRRESGEPVAVLDVVLDCVQSCGAAAAQHGVHLVPNLSDAAEDADELVVAGDAELLRTMLENLVFNAIHHSPAGERIAIDADATAHAVHIAVRDRGPGIPDDFLEKVFERFVQVPRDPSGRVGTGLGLAIARSIARMHEGRIAVENNAEGGCSFVVTLPRNGHSLG